MNEISELKVEIIDFEEKYAKDFARLNYEWLEKYFSVEPHDREMLDEPFKYIIKGGGFIFFAKYDEEIVGTAALIEENAETFELAKMGVSPKYQGLRIGEKLIHHSIEKSKEVGKHKVVLESSRKLKPAIGLYKKTGFIEVPLTGCSPYSRCDIRMKLDL